ncbi:hypothetical protein CYLTODRAFT_484576 [Cylindrobasidium torrendii FP15055 ss-10]|uniref:Uncharacterized protein n=1 Tax=Cylindrobasidium torrendii FP15055 ss-10 TaxID=1314674 RepID=A0A0D7BX86_9AGAR|nr:hypothetical protein CYLTODRAFT_484576 [Cylindrobasidium torrendii FP15055 ss-10]
MPRSNKKNTKRQPRPKPYSQLKQPSPEEVAEALAAHAKRPTYAGAWVEYPGYIRPTRSSAQISKDVEARGGEYTKEDRADLAVALAHDIWVARGVDVNDLSQEILQPKREYIEFMQTDKPLGDMEVRSIQLELEGHTLEFSFWRNPHLTHRGTCANYLYNHRCTDAPDFKYVVEIHDILEGWVDPKHNNVPSMMHLRVRSLETGEKVAVPHPPKIVLDWVDSDKTDY